MSSTRLASHGSLTGTRVMTTAGVPRVASTMSRRLWRDRGECSISIHRKSNPALAAASAVSTLGTLMVAPMTTRPSRSAFFSELSVGALAGAPPVSYCARAGAARRARASVRVPRARPGMKHLPRFP